MKTASCCNPPKAEKCRICGTPSPIRFLVKTGSSYVFACPDCSRKKQEAKMIEYEINRSSWSIAFSDPYQKGVGKVLRESIEQAYLNVAKAKC